MLSDHTLSGTESSSFFPTYDTFERNFNAILATGSEIQRQWDKAKRLRSVAKDPGDIQILEDQLSKWSEMWATYQEIIKRVNKWSAKWLAISRSEAGEEGKLGIIPFILPAWALGTLIAGGLAALTFVVVKGMDLVKQVQFEKAVLRQVGEKILSAGEAGKLIRSGQTALLNLDLGLPMLALLAVGGLYLFMRTR
jgi:hypothetical protein